MVTKGWDWYLEHFKKSLGEANLRLTHQRIAIYKAIVGMKTHPSADDIYQKIKGEFPTISFDTVNRTLLKFTVLGIIRTVESYSGVRRFDPNLDQHHHLHCVRCGKILDYLSSRFDEIILPRKIGQGFKPLGIRVSVNGICADCLE